MSALLCAVRGNGSACGVNRGGCEQLCKNLPVMTGTDIPSGYIWSCNSSYITDPRDPKSCKGIVTSINMYI